MHRGLGLAVLASCVFTASLAYAQPPQLIVTPNQVPGGGAVTVTVNASPGLFFAVVGSTRDAGLSYGGAALGIGTDVTILVSGFVPVGGTVSFPFAPPLGAGVEVYYLLAVTSTSPSFIPLDQSATIALRPRGFYTQTPVFFQGLSAGGARITDVATPIAATDAANKAYVDASQMQLAPPVSQATTTASSLINLEQRGSGDLMNLRTNSTTIPGSGGVNLNRSVFRVLPDGGFFARGELGVGVIPTTGGGYRLTWHPFKAAFRAGGLLAGHETDWDDANTGFYSWAGGSNTRATGFATFAFGDGSAATGVEAVAFGSNNVASGTVSLVHGANSTAGGFGSTALGYLNQALGQGSVALGYRVGSCQDYSVALGHRATTDPGLSGATSGNPCNVPAAGHFGAFIFGDESTTAYFATVTNNEFAVRAAGGFRFRTNATLTTGCNLPAGSGIFSCSSDRNLKEGFQDVDGEDVLAKLAVMPVQRWSYRTEPGVVHMGPVAQDFKAAFDLGVDDVTIGHLDEAGVSLRAIQALEARTRELRDENAELRRTIDELLGRLDRLEREKR